MKKSKKVTKKITQTRITETLNKVKRNKSIYEDEYLPADEEVIFHEGLEGLDVIKIRLPRPPDLRKIEGYDLPPLEQKFRYTELPPKLASLNAKNYLDVEDFWKEIEEDMDYFEDELPFILREWDRRKFGHWVFIKGKPTWIPPWQYMYLNYYGFINEIDGGKHPEYRDRDRKLFVGRWYAATTTEAPFKFKYWKEDEAPRYTSSEETVRKVEKKGYTVERNGYMVDMKVRTVMGTVEYKCRRSGYTSQCTNQGIEISSRMHKALFGLQSMTEDKAQELFEKQIIYGYKGYPFFFRPISENIVDPKRTMNFKPALKKSGTGNNKKLRIIKALYSEMTYGSSTVGYFDGSKLKYWLSDEFAKCLIKWTPVLMYDGSVKYVQDVVKGDELMGDDDEPRIVTSTRIGKQMTYDITPTEENWGIKWGCNESHILSLKNDKGVVLNISLISYLGMSDTIKSQFKLYKAHSEEKRLSGFTVQKREFDFYYGFTITGNSLFLLGDHTVTHNTKEIDVLERTLVVRKAMSTGNNALIQGYSNQISTAGDLKTGGGSAAKRLAQLSHWGKRNDNGQTGSGFINLFIPSDEGLENQVDEWGFSKKEAARDSILNTWKAFEDAQDWTSLNEEMRQTPLEWKHNFITNSKQARFNIHIIGNQIAFLSTYDKPLTIKGRFAWRNNSTHGYDIKKLPTRQDFLSGKDEVVFIPQDDDDYDWEISWMPDKTQTNKFTYLQDENKIIPGNVNKATHGIDPFKYKEKTSSGAGSLGGGAIFRLFDGAVDSPYVNPQGINPETGDFNHVTNRFCATYLKRPSSNEFCEQQLMADLFFGIKAYVETNVTDAYKWYKERGFEDYMFFAIDIKTGEENKVAGSDTTTKIINAIFNAWADHISFNGSREVHIQPLEQCAEIDDSMNDYDLFTACGYALIQAGAMRPIEIEVPDMFDASDIFQFEEIS